MEDSDYRIPRFKSNPVLRVSGYGSVRTYNDPRIPSMYEDGETDEEAGFHSMPEYALSRIFSMPRGHDSMDMAVPQSRDGFSTAPRKKKRAPDPPVLALARQKFPSSDDVSGLKKSQDNMINDSNLLGASLSPNRKSVALWDELLDQISHSSHILVSPQTSPRPGGHRVSRQIKDFLRSPRITRQVSKRVHHQEEEGRKSRFKKMSSFDPPDFSMLHGELNFGLVPRELVRAADFEVQRIPEYETFLTDILKKTDPSHPDYEDLSRAAAKVRNMVKEREYEEGNMDHQKRMERVQNKFPDDDLQLRDLDVYPKRQLASRRKSAPGAVLLKTIGKSKSTGNLLSQNVWGKKELEMLRPNRSQCNFNRQYLMEGPVEFVRGMQSQDRYMFLFSDLLLVAKQRSNTTFKLKQRIRVGELWISFCIDDVSEVSRAADRSFVIGWPTTNVVATFKSSELKDTWLNKLNEQIAGEREKQLPRALVLDVWNKDVDKVFNVEVDRSTQTTDVVKLCMDHFQIPEQEAKDYQLWVKVGHDEPPYPLIGHELPYSIKLSIVRDFAKKTDEALSESEVEQILAEMQAANRKADFILKHNKKSPKKQTLDDTAVKVKKSRKSPLINLFRRHRDEKKPPGKLFGHHLADVTTPEMLIAKPIKELMIILFREGPFTIGILRKSPNARICRELRQKLDDGEDCLQNGSEWPSLVIGALLKEFLRCIPPSLLMEDLFDDWIASNDTLEGEEKTDKFKETIGKLPACHSELLRHLMCVLYHIEQKKDENKMNAYNLSVCIAPSMLRPKGIIANTNPLATPTSMIQYMIEKFPEIFGEESLYLFGNAVEQKMRQDSSTDSDSMHSVLSMGNFRQDDSSIDSLDREMYQGDMDSSPQILKADHLSPSNLSGDSGLCDEDGTSNDIVNDRRQYLRSNSQYIERDIERQDTEGTSRSLDHFYFMDGHNPVPPPRKSKKKASEPSQMSPESFRKSSKYISQNNYLGNSGRYDKRLSAEQYRQYYKRRSSESLKSVEESSEADSEMNLKDWQTRGDIGTLVKSASGSHLFFESINNPCRYEFETLSENTHPKGSFKLNNSSTPLSPQSKYSLSSSRDSVLSDSSGSFLNRQNSPDPLSSPLETPDNDDRSMSEWLTQQSKRVAFSKEKQKRLYSHDDSELGLKSDKFPTEKQPSREIPTERSSMKGSGPPVVVKRAPLPSHSPLNARYSFPMQHPTSPVGSGSNTSKEAEDIIQSPKVFYSSHESLDQQQKISEQEPRTKPHLDLYNNNNNSMMKQINMYSAGLQGSSPPPRVVLQALGQNQNGQDKRDSSKPMKAIHDQAILSQVRRDSVDTLEDSVSSETEETSSDSEEEVLRVTSMVRLPPFSNSIPQSLVNDKKSPARNTQPRLTKLTSDSVVVQTSPVKAPEDSPSRPSNPPSYNEAIQRISMLKSGIPLENESDEETVRQREVSSRAKQLYEQSMKIYSEQSGRFGPPSQQFEQRLSVLGERQEDGPSQEVSDSSSDDENETLLSSPEPQRPEKDPKKLYEESVKKYQAENLTKSPSVKKLFDNGISNTKGDTVNKNLLRVSSLQRSCSDVGDSRLSKGAFLNRRSTASTSPSKQSSHEVGQDSKPPSRDSTPSKRPEHPPPYDAPPPYRRAQSRSPAPSDRHQFPRATQYGNQREPESNTMSTSAQTKMISGGSHSGGSPSGSESQPRQDHPAAGSHRDTKQPGAVSRSVDQQLIKPRIAVSVTQSMRDSERSVQGREVISSTSTLSGRSSNSSRGSSVESPLSTVSSNTSSTSLENRSPYQSSSSSPSYNSSAKHLSTDVFRSRTSSKEGRGQSPATRSSSMASPVRATSAPQPVQQPIRSREKVVSYRDQRRASLDSRSRVDAKVTGSNMAPKQSTEELPWSVKRLSNIFDGQVRTDEDMVTRSANASPARPYNQPLHVPPPTFQRRDNISRSSTSSNSSVSSAGTGHRVQSPKRTYKYGPQARGDSFSSTDGSECSCRYSLSCQRDNSSLEELDNLSFSDISYV